jgi:adenylate kinase
MFEQDKGKIRKLKIVFIGRPGSGKGTQVDLLHKRLGLILIPSPGEIYRDQEFRKTELGKKIFPLIDRGEFAPNEVTNQLMKEKILKLTENNTKGFISEGYPRTLGQAEFADKEIGIDLLINLEVPEKEIIQRLSNRRICPKCKVNYNLIKKPPKKENICDLCQVPLIQRDDDKRKAVENRMKVYRETAEPTIAYYRRQDKVIDVNGNQSVDNVFEEIISLLREKTTDSKTETIPGNHRA